MRVTFAVHPKRVGQLKELIRSLGAQISMQADPVFEDDDEQVPLEAGDDAESQDDGEHEAVAGEPADVKPVVARRARKDAKR